MTQRDVVVLFPGALGRAASLRPVLDFLSRHRRPIAIESHELPLHPERAAEMIVARLDALPCARAHYVGFSLGGEVARQAALVAPDRCASLVLVAAGAPDPARGRRIRGRLPLLRLLPAFLLRRRWRRELDALLRADDPETDAARWRAFDLLRELSRRELVRARERLAALDESAVAERVLPDSIPVLRLEPEHDEVISPGERARLEKLLPHSVVEAVAGVGHGATLVLPMPLLQRIEAWLDRWSVV
jgi:esterase